MAMLAQISLDKTLFPFPPSQDTMLKWMTEAVEKRKAEVGRKGKKDVTGAGDEEEQDAAAAGRAYVDFSSPLSVALDDFIHMENEVLEEKKERKEGKEENEKLAEELMAEAMGGKKMGVGVRPARAHPHTPHARVCTPQSCNTQARAARCCPSGRRGRAYLRETTRCGLRGGPSPKR